MRAEVYPKTGLIRCQISFGVLRMTGMGPVQGAKMAYMVDTLLRVAAAGGSLVLGARCMPDSLVSIAAAMRGKGGT